jgi:phosphoribosylformylglycinamidine cyclo-ligase
MMIVVAPDQAERTAALLASMGETVIRMGSVVEGQGVTYSGALL